MCSRLPNLNEDFSTHNGDSTLEADTPALMATVCYNDPVALALSIRVIYLREKEREREK